VPQKHRPAGKVLPGEGVKDASEQPAFRERDAALGGDDEMIQHPNLDQSQGILL
jgi:hypothetical protein